MLSSMTMPPLGKSGPGNDGHELVHRGPRAALGQHELDGREHLAQVVRRHVGGHADRDARGAVDQQVGQQRRQDDRLARLAVVGGTEVDGVLVELGAASPSRRRSGGTRCSGAPPADRRASRSCPAGRRRVMLRGEVLRHAHERLVDGAVAVGVELGHGVADDVGALAVWAVGTKPHLLHRRTGCGAAPA